MSSQCERLEFIPVFPKERGLVFRDESISTLTSEIPSPHKVRGARKDVERLFSRL